MRFFNFLIFILIFSCSSKKDILLVQDTSNKFEYDIEYNNIKVKTDDILKIQISTQSLELTELFRGAAPTTLNNLVAYQLEGYNVNSKGYINFPSVGLIMVKGLSVAEISNLIQKLLVEKGILLNPTVDVKIVNSYFTILGEVNNPGRYNFIKNNMNIIQALGMAGDLTINGERKDIKILRETDKGLKVSEIDLTSSEFLTSSYFQIYPNDVIIVNPNKSRVKNAGVIGNAGNLLSVLSFILSSIILITNQ